MTFTLALTAIGTAEAQTTQTSYVEPRAVAYAVEPAPQQDPNATTTVVDGGLMGAGVTLTVIGAVSLAASLVHGVIAFIVAIASRSRVATMRRRGVSPVSPAWAAGSGC